MNYSVKRIVIQGNDGEYEDFVMPEGAVIVRTYGYEDMFVLYVAVPNEETAE
jgi:hypothetical protein